MVVVRYRHPAEIRAESSQHDREHVDRATLEGEGDEKSEHAFAETGAGAAFSQSASFEVGVEYPT